jgi:hypothetical protein
VSVALAVSTPRCINRAGYATGEKAEDIRNTKRGKSEGRISTKRVRTKRKVRNNDKATMRRGKEADDEIVYKKTKEGFIFEGWYVLEVSTLVDGSASTLRNVRICER